jgi:hypothetical protein
VETIVGNDGTVCVIRTINSPNGCTVITERRDRNGNVSRHTQTTGRPMGNQHITINNNNRFGHNNNFNNIIVQGGGGMNM